MTVAQKETAASFVIINPATGKEVTTYLGHSDAEVEVILADVGIAQRKWQGVPFPERSRHFRAISVASRASPGAESISMQSPAFRGCGAR